ncbi:uncharacterized protein DDB_G0283357-like isoform X2 [Panonychus citri]|uniref:uncharacterized protein DDB_G0283357-like isoform X2 n=1 Tax=Panonychus citri TaxID=50023 RepID=UPI002307B502|nr:uncharacterized protein DDB_G0283357-like isoform X2 [Panonychus citri]
MSYIEGKILEIVPISEVPYESFTENYHEIDPNDSHDNETISKTTSTTTITIPTERSTSADLEIEESSLHHQISSLSAESDDGDIKRNGNGNDEKSNHDETPVDVTESTSKQQQDENINHNNNTNGNSALSSSASPHLASSPLSKVNDLRTSANSVAVKVTEVKKKSLAAKMMERLRKSDKGTDDAKKNIIVVSNGGSGGGGGSHGGHSGLNGGGSRHHHHHHLQSHLSPTEQQIPGHQVVPIFTPIDEHPHLQQQNQAHGQQIGGHHHHHGNDPESHGQAYPLFQDGRGGSSGNGNGGGRGEEGRSILPGETPSSAGHHIDGHLGSLGSNIGNGGGDANSGGGGNGEITGHPHHVHGLSGSPGNPGNLDSPVDSPWPPHVGSLVGPNSEPTDALGRGGGGGGGHTLTHHDPITAGGPISSISGSSGPTSAEHLHHRFQSGSLGELVRAAGLTLNPPRSEQMSPEITPFFETSKSDSRGDTLINPLTGNTASSLKGFSLLSDSASLSNLRSLLGGSSSSDLTSSLLGSSLTSGSGGSSSTSSGPSSGSLNDRLLSSLLEQSSKTSTLDDLNEQLNPLHGAGHHHALTELTSSRLGSSSGLLGEDIGFDDALKRLTMIEMLNKKQIPLTTTLIDELRGEPSPLHTLSGVNGNPLSLLDGDLRKLKNLQQLAQVQQAIKKSQQTSLKAKSSFDQIGGQLEDDDQPQDHRSGNNNEGRAAISTRYRLSGNINGANRGSSSIESGPTGERRIRPGQKVKTLDALTKLRQQRERFRDHFRPSTKSKMEEEEEEYEESGVEHEGDESRSLLLGWKKPSRSEVDSTILTDNFHHLNGQVINHQNYIRMQLKPSGHY